MAFSTKSNRGGSSADATVSVRQDTRRPLAAMTLLGAGLGAALCLSAVYLSVGKISSSAFSASGGKGEGQSATLEIALLDNGPDKGTSSRKTRRPVTAADREAAAERMEQAILAMEDPQIAVLPDNLDLAAVDKSERVARASVLRDEQAVAILRQTLADAADERVVRLALADQLAKSNASLSREAQMLAAAEANDAFTTGSIPSSAVLAYATPSSARETLASMQIEEPFGEVLAESEEPEFALPEDIPLPAVRPKRAIAKAVPEPTQKNPVQLAYAKPESPIDQDNGFSLFNRKPKLPGRGSRIAIYDITAQVVYMPNGEKLEAHSGRGPTKDSPKYVHVKGKGSTPPNVYSLRMRESLFHGVEAIRMTPVGDAKMYGRDGLLTHSYLRRIPGDSAGCIAFADYKRFLKAFKRGEVTKIIVVPSIKQLPTYMAML